MNLNYVVKLCLMLILVGFFTATGFCASSYDRELIVKDKLRADQVESVFKKLMSAYEDEDARGFLDLVSDERFRQDYMTFTDALYSDFRNYEIRQVDYWIDRVVSDHIKQFLYVKWEKRYEDLDSMEQRTTRGYSRFLFDEIDGKYLLVELAGNPLFGGSLPEWLEEMPPIAGQEVVQQTPEIPIQPGATCDGQHLSLCDGSNCSSNGGYWYAGTCNTVPAGQPDLAITVIDVQYTSSDGTVYYEIENSGTTPSTACQVAATYPTLSGAPATASDSVSPLAVGEIRSGSLYLPNYYYSGGGDAAITIDSTHVVSESNESNNTANF